MGAGFGQAGFTSHGFGLGTKAGAIFAKSPGGNPTWTMGGLSGGAEGIATGGGSTPGEQRAPIVPCKRASL